MKMAISTIYAPKSLIIGGIALTALVVASPNVLLWAACFLTLAVAVWLVGGNKAYPVLAWIIAIFWLQVFGDVLVSELIGVPVNSGWLGPYHQQAIFFSLAALVAIAYGARCGMQWGIPKSGSASKVSVPKWLEKSGGVDFHRAVLSYFISLVLTEVATRLAVSVPALAQPVLALALLKWVSIYLIAAKTFETNRGFFWLGFVVLIEVATGMLSFFATYKESVFVILVALASSRRKMPVGYVMSAFVAVMAVVWISMIWSIIKNEYRGIVYSLTTQQKIEWVWEHYSASDIKYFDALLSLSQRVGYTTLFAHILAKDDAGTLRKDFNFYQGAVVHVVTPRILFPDKPALNDSVITTALVGLYINDQTSIGVGYVAQAYVDFGFPGFLAPLWVVGLMLGYGIQYFMTRPVPLMLRSAFATATFFQTYQFAGNIDKEFGGFVIAVLAMSLILKYGYPIFALWLAGADTGRVSAPTRPLIAKRTV